MKTETQIVTPKELLEEEKKGGDPLMKEKVVRE